MDTRRELPTIFLVLAIAFLLVGAIRAIVGAGSVEVILYGFCASVFAFARLITTRVA